MAGEKTNRDSNDVAAIVTSFFLFFFRFGGTIYPLVGSQ